MRIPTSENCKFFTNTAILSSFLSEMRKYPALSVAEEEELFEHYKSTKDEDARQKLILHNLSFIYSIAKIYAKNETELLDYVNEGVAEMDEAIKKFDPNMGYKFITYAVWYIKRGMNHYLNDTKNAVNRSNAMKYGAKIEAIKQKHFSKDGHIPTVAEIKAEMEDTYGIKVKNDEDLYDVSITSINETIDADDDYTMEQDSEFSTRTASYCECEKTFEQEEISYKVNQLLSDLTPKQTDIVKMAFGIGYERPYEMEEIAEKYNCRTAVMEKMYGKIMQYLGQKKKVSVMVQKERSV